MQSPTGAPSTAVPMNTAASTVSAIGSAPSDVTPPARADEMKELDDGPHDHRDHEQPEAGVDEIEPQREHRRALAPEEGDVVEHARQRPCEQPADDEEPRDGGRAAPGRRQQAYHEVEGDLAAVLDYKRVG